MFKCPKGHESLELFNGSWYENKRTNNCAKHKFKSYKVEEYELDRVNIRVLQKNTVFQKRNSAVLSLLLKIYHIHIFGLSGDLLVIHSSSSVPHPHQFLITSSLVFHQFFISFPSVLHPFFISSSSVLPPFFISSSSVLKCNMPNGTNYLFFWHL